MNKREELLMREVEFLRGIISSLTKQNEKLVNQMVAITGYNQSADMQSVDQDVVKRSSAIEKHISQIMGLDDEEDVGQQ